VIRWRSWHHWTAVCLLACLYPAVAVALQREHDASSDLGAGLIPVTIPELLRLLRGIVVLWTTRTRSVRPTMARTKRIALAPCRSRHTDASAVCIAAMTAAARSPHRRRPPGAARPRSRHHLGDQPQTAPPSGARPPGARAGPVVDPRPDRPRQTAPDCRSPCPAATRIPQPHPGYHAGPDPLRPARLTRECLPPPRPRHRQHSSTPPSTSPAEPGPPGGR
jgi:hypothetical protein